MHHLVANSELLVDLVDRHTVVEVEDPDRLALAGELPILEAERMSAATDSFGSFDDFLDVLDVLLCFERFVDRSEEHTSELQSRGHLVCRLLLEKKNIGKQHN